MQEEVFAKMKWLISESPRASRVNPPLHVSSVGLAQTIRCIYGIFGGEITNYTVIQV